MRYIPKLEQIVFLSPGAKLKTMSTNEIDEALCEKALRETSRACVRINLFED
jgi:hypothetical protein